MITRTLPILILALLFGCEADDGGSSPASTRSGHDQAIEVAESNPLDARDLLRDKLGKARRVSLSRSSVLRYQRAARGDRSCLEQCGETPFCLAICGEDDLGRIDAFAGSEQLPGDDCLECGRETGFAPVPPTVEAHREGQFVVIDWSDVAGAEQYDVVVRRQKDGRGDFEDFAVETVAESELRLSMLAAGYVYVFQVMPYIDGEAVERLMGSSAPLAL